MKNRIRIIRNAIIAVLFTSLVSCDVLDVELPSVISGNSFGKQKKISRLQFRECILT